MNKTDYAREYYRRNKDRLRPIKAARMRKYRRQDPEKYRQKNRDIIKARRNKLLDMYGHKCAVCGFADPIALTLDHINNNGNVERKAIGERGVYKRAIEKYRPKEYRTLCMNCQFIERVSTSG